MTEYLNELKEAHKARRQRFKEAGDRQRAKIELEISNIRGERSKSEIMAKHDDEEVIDDVDPDIKIPVKLIIRATCEQLKVRSTDFFSGRRLSRFAYARQVASYMANRMTTASSVAIGKVANRDHTTVLYGIRKTELLIECGNRFTLETVKGIEALVLAKLRRTHEQEVGHDKESGLHKGDRGDDGEGDREEDPFS